jgi:EAL domain-containing protein (putative c-di-GMP-specific phosphodiesterase class I)
MTEFSTPRALDLDPAWFGDAAVPPISGEHEAVARWRGVTLTSAFQPIVALRDHQVLGHAARIRTPDAAPGAPRDWAAIAQSASDFEVLQRDRLARTLHAINYRAQVAHGARLFLRVQPRLVATVRDGHGRVFERILARLGIPTRAVVIELPSMARGDITVLERAVASYRSLGYRVACDWTDGAEPPLNPAGAVVPDVVRLDLRYAEDADRFQRRASRVRAAGAVVLAARIESADALAAARDSGAELALGFHLGRPSTTRELVTHGPSRGRAPATEPATS